MFRCIDEKKKKLEMIEGDFGIILPITLETESEETITAIDSFSIKIFSEINTTPLITKTYTNIQNNTIEFELTESESALLHVGTYYYDLDWFQGQNFLGNLIAGASLSVREKAGVVNES